MDLIIPSFDGLLARWTICLPLPFSFSAPLWWPHSLFLFSFSFYKHLWPGTPFVFLHLAYLYYSLRPLFIFLSSSFFFVFFKPYLRFAGFRCAQLYALLSFPGAHIWACRILTVSFFVLKPFHWNLIFLRSLRIVFKFRFFLVFSSLSRIFMDDLIFMLPCISEFPGFVDLLFLQFKHFPFLIWFPNSIVFISKHEHRFRLVFLFSPVIKPHHIRCSLSVYLPVCFSAPLHISYLFPPPPGFSLVLCSPSPPSALAAAFDPLSSPSLSIFFAVIFSIFRGVRDDFCVYFPNFQHIWNFKTTWNSLKMSEKTPFERAQRGPFEGDFSCSDARFTHFVTFGQENWPFGFSLSDYNPLIKHLFLIESI